MPNKPEPSATVTNPIKFETAVLRSDWVVASIYAYNHPFAATASQELATKMALLAKNPFSFYRGTNPLFFQDMGVLPDSAYTSTQTAFTWLGGDTHLDNFEAARDSTGTVVFKVSDFDEGYLGQYVWDLRRLATSLVLAGHENDLSDKAITAAIELLVDAYVDALGRFENDKDELDFRLVKGNTSGVIEDVIAAAEAKKRADLLDKYTEVSKGKRRFQNVSNLLALEPSTYKAIEVSMVEYINSIAVSKRHAADFYTIKDIRQRLGSGAGSLGRLRYYVLLEGPSDSNADDVILEMKQSVVSAVAQIVPGQLPAAIYDHHEGKRVALTAKAQQLNADVLIGYTTVDGVPYFAHEKMPRQKDFDHTLLDSERKLNAAAPYFGQALASAHALADQDYDSGNLKFNIDKAIASVVTSKSGLKVEMVEFAFKYAEQVVLDWQAFVVAYKAGRSLY